MGKRNANWQAGDFISEDRAVTSATTSKHGERESGAKFARF